MIRDIQRLAGATLENFYLFMFVVQLDHAPVPQAKVAAKFTAKRKQPRRSAAKAAG